MNKQKRQRKASQLSRKLSTRFLLCVMGYLLMLFGGYFLAYFLCSQRTWQKEESLYYLLKTLQHYSPVLIAVAVFVGLVVLTRYFISVPLRYLDEVIAAAAQLASSKEEPVVLPPAMLDTQNELNLVREQALNAAHAAREAEQRKNDLVVYLAHDLKTPLTSVIGYLTLLRDEPEISRELRAKYTGIALSKAERLEELINEFFDITRFNLTHLELNRQTINLTRMLEQITYEFGLVMAEKELVWDLHLAPDVELFCDPDKLQRVFDNLFRNAVNYSYRGTEIYVLLEQCGGSVEILVRNHGKTIPQEKLKRIFEQFFRLDSSRGSSTGGAGLGLAIAKEIVELHGGSIHAESAAEVILFTVSLPR